MMPLRRFFSLFLLVGLSVVACDDAPTGPGSASLALAPESGDGQTATIAQSASDPLVVRVTNDAGEGVADMEVRFLETEGRGSVSSHRIRTDESGRASTSFQATSAGSARVRADLPRRPDVAPAEFHIDVVPAGHGRVTIVAGDDQIAEPGSRLPRALRVRVVGVQPSPEEHPVVWTVARGTEGAAFVADTTYTNKDGLAEALFTLGREAGRHEVTARLGGDLASDTARFVARATDEVGTDLQVDSVRPTPLRPGEPATVFGAGFSGQDDSIEVWVEGRPAAVTGGGEGRVTLDVPALDDRCWPRRTSDLRIVAGEASSRAHPVSLQPGGKVDLAAGSTARLRGPDALECVRLGEASDHTELLLALQSAANQSGARSPVDITLRTSDETSIPEISLDRAPTEASIRVAEEVRDGALALRQRARRTLLDRGARPARTHEGVKVSASVTTDAQVGDTLSYNFAVEHETLSVTCEAPDSQIEAVVRGRGEEVLLVVDAQTPEGVLSEADWEGLTEELDRTILPNAYDYFGEPADIDGNGRVIVLVTPEVNRLSPPDAATVIGGFFLSLDLADDGDEAGGGVSGPGGESCPASNEAEIVYLPAPDPTGAFSRPMSRIQALRNTRSVVAHEVEHLLSAEQRVFFGAGDFAQLEVVWLGEGLSHIAEEVAGHAVTGRGPGSNLDLADFPDGTTGNSDFRAFHLSNFSRLGLYLSDPTATDALALSDPMDLEGIRMRGFAWAFLRWLADTHAAGDERALFRALSSGGGGQHVGVANVEVATGHDWEDLIADFALAVSADDHPAADLSVRHRFASWDLPAIYEGLTANSAHQASFPYTGFPLAPIQLPSRRGVRLDLDLRASTAAYLSMVRRRGDGPVALEIHRRGEPLPLSVSPQLLIARLR